VNKKAAREREKTGIITTSTGAPLSPASGPLKMQEMSYLQDNSKIEALTKAVLISILGVAIVLSNLLIIATYANFKGTLHA